jgi:hypothetical protein
MNTLTPVQLTEDEQTLITIARKLPPERLPSLVEFAHFLEFQAAKAGKTDWYDEDEEPVETEEDMTADEAKWDELFSRPESKRLLRKLAREARAEYRAGNTTEIQITDDGRLAPQ